MAGNESGASRLGEGAAGDQAEVAAIVGVMQLAATAVVQGSPAGVTGTFATEGDVTSPRLHLVAGRGGSRTEMLMSATDISRAKRMGVGVPGANTARSRSTWRQALRS